MKKLRRFVTLLIFLGLVAAGFVYLQTDRRVAEHIKHAGLNSQPAILSAPLALSKGLPLSKQELVKELELRRYNLVQKSLREPGDYIVTENAIDIYLRHFVLARGETTEERRIRYSLTDGSVIDLLNASLPEAPVFLEPLTLSQLGDGNIRISSFVPLQKIPEALKKAVIAIEDQRFYEHFGIDLIGITRALYTNLKAGRIVQGGSTLTQQLAKNLLFTRRKTISRKLYEAFAALSLERRLNKQEILELYLNEVYLGQEGSFALHGVQSAAQAFFNKSVENISLSEAALLAGLVQAPSSYSPRRFPERARKRRNTVLDAMHKESFITTTELQKAKNVALNVSKEKHSKRTAPFFLEALRQNLQQEFDYEAGITNGMRIYTGLIPAMQSCAENAIENGLRELTRRLPALKKQEKQLQAALLALSPYNGMVRAWVGGKDYRISQYDHVWQSVRQIGSTVKPFLYLTALDGSLNNYRVATARSILSDRPVTIEVSGNKEWTPQNYTKRFAGDVTLRYALEHSLNIPAVYVAQRIGVESLAHTLQIFGVSDRPPAVPSLALGAAETSLLKLTAGYAALANGGKYISPRLYFTVLDQQTELISASNFQESTVADENAVYVLTNILQGVVQRGTARSIRQLGFNRDAAGKTGTSNEERDAWFVGYTPSLVAGVWVGFDDNRKLGLTGGSAAAPIWTEFMKCSEPYYADMKFLRPPGVLSLEIDATSGLRASDRCAPDNVITEIYVAGTEPTQFCGYERSGDFEKAPPRGLAERLDEQYIPKRRRKSFWEMIFGE